MIEIERIYPLFILIGLTLFLVTLYYNTILRQLMRVLTSLLELQENRNTDVREYIKSLEKKLHSLGIETIFYDIHYLNKHLLRENTQAHGKILKKDIYYKNITGSLFLEVKKNKGEYKIINKLILYVITLQIVNAIYTDIEKINESFARIAKLQTYMVHDLKNVLQFFQLMQYNVASLQTQEQKEHFINFLQDSTQPLNHKVNKILSLLQIESNLQLQVQKHKLHIDKIIKHYIQQYKLPCTFTQENVEILSDEATLHTIFENIFSNIHYKAAQDSSLACWVTIEKKNHTYEIIIQDNGEKFQNPQQVTQPFYTTKDDGLGIGMYQVQSLIERLGGTLECKNIDEKATFILHFPLNIS